MAESAFNFNQAPSHKGRQFAAVSSIGKLFSGKSSSGGLSARDTAALMDKQHAHEIGMQERQTQAATLGSVVGHVLGKESAEQAHGHAKELASHHLDLAHNASTNPGIKSADFQGGKFSFNPPAKGPQFDNEGPSTTNAPSSGSVNLEN